MNNEHNNVRTYGLRPGSGRWHMTQTKNRYRTRTTNRHRTQPKNKHITYAIQEQRTVIMFADMLEAGYEQWTSHNVRTPSGALVNIVKKWNSWPRCFRIEFALHVSSAGVGISPPEAWTIDGKFHARVDKEFRIADLCIRAQFCQKETKYELINQQIHRHIMKVGQNLNRINYGFWFLERRSQPNKSKRAQSSASLA